MSGFPFHVTLLGSLVADSSCRHDPRSASITVSATYCHQVAYHSAYDASPVAACNAAAVAVPSAATQCIRLRTTGAPAQSTV